MKALEVALDRRDAPLDVFFRDDDAGWEMEALDRMLEIFSRHACPVDLAVIPGALDVSVATRLNAWRVASPRIGFHQHGYSHQNHEPTGERKCEFGPTRSTNEQCGDIAVGRRLLSAYLGDTDPIFTPPWNRCSAGATAHLPELGFAMVSADGPPPGVGPGLAQLHVTFDWEKARRQERLEAALAHALAAETGPVGLMLHHATLDGPGFDALDTIVGLLGRGAMITVRSMRHWLGR